MRVCVRRGFTLIELLVVIALIAVLAALLFPVVLSVKERANTGKCQAHEKELCAALMLYIEDYRGRMPSMQFLSWWKDGNFEVHLYDKYVKNNDIVICPQPYYDTAHNPPGIRRMAYGYNECLVDPLPNYYYTAPGSQGKIQVYGPPKYYRPGRGRMLSEVPTPTRTPCFFCTFSHHTSPDGIPRGFGWGADDAVNLKRHPNRHGTGSNYAFLDGHVAFYRPAGGIFCVPIDGLDYDGNGTYGGNGIMR